MLKMAVAALFLATNFYTYHYLARDAVFPDRKTFSDFPDELGGFTCVERETLDDGIVKNLGVCRT